MLAFRDHHIIQDKLNSRSLIYWQLQRPFFSKVTFISSRLGDLIPLGIVFQTSALSQPVLASETP